MWWLRSELLLKHDRPLFKLDKSALRLLIFHKINPIRLYPPIGRHLHHSNLMQGMQNLQDWCEYVNFTPCEVHGWNKHRFSNIPDPNLTDRWCQHIKYGGEVSSLGYASLGYARLGHKGSLNQRIISVVKILLTADRLGTLLMLIMSLPSLRIERKG